MKRIILSTLSLFCLSLGVSAHDFFVNKIYYVKNSNGTSVSVSYAGTTYDQYSGEYSGSVSIPPSVTYSGKTYSVTRIASGAFRDCSGLTSVTIPNSVTEISQYAFSGCRGLKSIEIPNSVTSILYGAFYGCSGLTSVTSPNSVTSIGGSVFSHCYGLTSVTIGSAVTSIGYEAFSLCFRLTSVTNYAATPQSISLSVFEYDIYSLCRLYVKSEYIDRYKAAPVWKNFPIAAGVEDVEIDDATKEVEGYYDLQGIRIKEPTHGQVNIVRYTDGTAEKIIIK